MKMWILLLCILIPIVRSADWCPPVSSLTVELSCMESDEEVSCAEPMVNGTVIHTSCIKDHYNDKDMNRKITCVQGKWNHPIPNCIPECGEEKGTAMSFSIGSKNVRRGEVPWHAAIYNLQDDETFKQVCGGTLVSPRVVISAAHCFYNDHKRETYHPLLYEVAVGKIYREYNHSEDNYYNYVQYSGVKEIFIPTKYGGHEQSYQADIALLIIENPFNFSQSVHAACLNLVDDSFDQTQIAQGNVGKASGWGLAEDDRPSPVLKMVALPIVDLIQCQHTVPESFRKFLTLDKICVGYRNGSNTCEGDSGGGLVFSNREGSRTKWYLRGIVSVGVMSENNKNLCSKDTYSGFTHVHKHNKWINRIIRAYKISDAYLPNANCLLNVTKKTCEPLTSPFVDFICMKNTKVVSCKSHIESGTVASATCKPNYISEKAESSVMYCNRGTWSNYTLPECTEDCGIVDSEDRSRLPWSVGIYRKRGKIYFSQCGGSIVSVNAIITSADCFWADLGNLGMLKRNYGVGIVDLQQDTYIITESDLLQIKNIEIFPPLNLNDLNKHSEIAVVRLSQTLHFSTRLHPACLHPTTEILDKFNTSVPGKTAFWKQSDTFHNYKKRSTSFTSLAVEHTVEIVIAIDTDMCDNRVNEICIKIRETLKCAHESEGSGLVLKDHGTKRWYLRGVSHMSEADLEKCMNGEAAFPIFMRLSKYFIPISKYLMNNSSM